MEICKLCLNNKPLVNSHIIPQFVTKWIRETSVTGKMRPSITPNRRVQDTKKIKLLCKDCENLFSGFERYFAETIFKPAFESDNPDLEYDDRLLKFAVSLSWRCLACENNKTWQAPAHKIAAEQAKKRWREFLLHDTELNGYEHHLLMLRPMLGVPQIEGSDFILHINWYFFRAIDGTVMQNSEEAFVYVKLPGFLFVSPIQPEPFPYMKGTLIKKTGKLEIAKQKPDQVIFECLKQRFRVGLSPFKNLSEIQINKITEDHQKNWDKIQDSYGFKVLMAHEIKGELL